MNINFKKGVLIALILPAGFHWLGISLLGLMIFARDTFRDLPSLFVISTITVGIIALSVAVMSVICYPKISQFSVYSVSAGCTSLTIALFMGFYGSPSFLISAISLYLGSIFLIVEYVRGN
ncbi:hypothetical protein ACFSJY_06350 [Thalassotalea euphylliae]|uniref:hypothetical protein n=1 Tax=Thalassotalea euphylliae TaxID=1655234 RepID=UPI0036268A98